MADYPTGYPCPGWQYAESQTQYHRRTAFDCGWTRQRQQFDAVGQTASMTYTMTTSDLSAWLTWAQESGYDWFNATLDNYTGTPLIASIRFITDLNIAYSEFDTVIISVSAEFQNA